MKKLLMLLGLTVVLAALCGCTGAENQPLALAVVAGVHSNAGSIPLNAEAVSSQLYDVSYTQGSAAVIRADGAPAVVFQTRIPELQDSGLSENRQRLIAEDYAAQLQNVLREVRAQAGEVDTLEAIRLGGQALAQKNACRKRLLVLDTGLSSTGYLDFTQGLLASDATDIVEALAQARALPQLEGVEVLWAMCGQTAAPQPELNEQEKQALKDIWSAVLMAGGAESIQFLTDFAGEAYTNLPPVSVVDAGERAIRVEIPTTVLSDAQVQFKGNSDQFVDERSAVQALSGAAQELAAHPDRRACLVGTTASGQNRQYCLELSKRRAEAVAALLAKYWGIERDRFVCVGLGAEDPWHVPDLDSEGRLVETYAAQNRKVILMDLDGSDAVLLSRA